MEERLENSFFFRVLLSPVLSYRITRYILLWASAIWGIHQAFEFLAKSISATSQQQLYVHLATLFFGGLTISGYLIITQLAKNFILVEFRFGLFVCGILAVHVITAELVRWHFIIFTDFLTLSRLPRAYTTYKDHITQLQFWQAPFDWVVVWYFSFSLFYNYLLYAVGLKIFKDLFVIKLQQSELEKINSRLEFDFLKAQINPHFLFNTLNNIYSFSVTSPDKVSDSLLKLADLMRYTLYETSEEMVPLQNELTFLNSYLELHRIRHDDHVTIHFKINGYPTTQYIPPLLLIIFVENAFKHGIQSSSQTSWVTIEIDIELTSITLRISNSIPTHGSNTLPGIGLYNVRKRLEYLYPNQYELIIQPQPNQFSITLMLNVYESVLPGYGVGRRTSRP